MITDFGLTMFVNIICKKGKAAKVLFFKRRLKYSPISATLVLHHFLVDCGLSVVLHRPSSKLNLFSSNLPVY